MTIPHPSLEVRVERQGTVTILHCRGNLDLASADLFKTTLKQLRENKQHRLVIDGAALQFIDSVGLGALVALKRQLATCRGDVKLCNLTPDVQSIFEITHLHRHFDLCPDVAHACQKFLAA